MKYYECIKSYTNKEIGEIYSEEDKPLWFKNYDSVAHFVKESPHRNSFFKEIDKIKTEVIPEYVECIKGDSTEDFNHLGKIYKVEYYNPYTGGIKILGEQINSIFFGEKSLIPKNNTDYKPSTKEAYEAQNKLKQLTVGNLIEGEFYYHIENKNIVKWKNPQPKYYLGNNSTDYSNKPNGNFSNNSKEFKLATNEEKKWLNTCISQDKFIPKEDLHLYDDSGLLVKMNEKMKSILEEAKERYPIGTKFKSVVTRNLFTVKNHVNEAKNSNIAFHTIESNSSGNHWGCVHENGTWAEIISLPNEQVQKEKSLVEQVEQGLKLKGRWLKCIKECDWNNITIGEYIQILQNNDLVPNVKWADNEKDYCLDLCRVDRKEFELMPEDFSPNEEEWIPKVGDWCVTTTHYNDEIWYKGRIWQIGKIDEDGYCIPIKNKKLLEQSLKIGFRKALPHEIPNQYSLTFNESFQTAIYDFGGIHIPSITKKSKKLQTITIESTTDLNLGLTKIKSKQIQTIKI